MANKSSGDKAKIRAMIKAWSKALERRDVDAMMANYELGAVLFDIKPPRKTVGVKAIKQVWIDCLPYFPKKFVSRHSDLKIEVGGDMAICHGLHKFESSSEPNHPACGSAFRVTVCFRKSGGKWRVVHEHVSLPFDPRSGQVTYIK